MKPWQTKEWRDMRKRRIGDRCEQCDSTDGPFVLQHFSHDYSEPPSKNQVVWELMNEYDQVPPRPTVQRSACPECKKRSLTERKKLEPKWRCIGCHHEFDEPVTVAATINNRTEKGAWVRWKKEVLFPARDDFLVAHQDLVEQRYRAVMNEYEVDCQTSHDKYMSGEGTTTFCKKCAFLWDMRGQKLCSKCKASYHTFRYQTCYNCLPAWRKEEIKGHHEIEEEMAERQKRIEKELEEAYGGPDDSGSPGPKNQSQFSYHSPTSFTVPRGRIMRGGVIRRKQDVNYGKK